MEDLDRRQLLPGRAARGCGTPAILNTDQSSQYQGKSWKDALDSYRIIPSMDGRGRWSDNVICERLWRTLKYEWLFVREYASPEELEKSLGEARGSTTARDRIRAWTMRLPMLSMRGDASLHREEISMEEW